MITTFIIDTPVLIAFGLIFARFSYKGFLGGLIAVTIFVISVVSSYFIAPDWMWMYFILNSKIPLLFLLYIIFSLYYVPYVFGFFIGKKIFLHSKVYWTIFLVFIIIIEAYLIFSLWPQYSVIGTYDEYLIGSAISIFKPNKLSLILNITPIILILYFIFFLFYSKRYQKL